MTTTAYARVINEDRFIAVLGHSLWVANAGPQIPPEILTGLFRPFFRGGNSSKPTGPGLYIGSEIARVHGGTLGAISIANETRFTFQMPL